MRAVALKAKGEYKYEPELIDMPKPGPGEVLIKVECAVVNPIDINFVKGGREGKYEYPVAPGVEGSGTVIASGGGWYAWYLEGKRVGFSR